MRRAAVLGATFGLLATPLAMIGAATPAAQAIPPCHGETLDYIVKKGPTHRIGTTKTAGYYNATKNPVVRTFTFKTTRVESTRKTWYVKGKAKAGWGPVSAEIEAKYGKETFEKAKLEKGTKSRFKVPVKHTGWSEVNWYVDTFDVTRKFYSYNPNKRRCVIKYQKFVKVRAPYEQSRDRVVRGSVNPKNY